MAVTQSLQLVNVVVPKEGEADDVSFIRTVFSSIVAATVQHNTAYLAQEDVVCLLCSSGDGSRKGYLAADGFGSEFCYLEPDTKGEVSPMQSTFQPASENYTRVLQSTVSYEPSELWKCTFQLEEALSVHALSTYKPKKVPRLEYERTSTLHVTPTEAGPEKDTNVWPGSSPPSSRDKEGELGGTTLCVVLCECCSIHSPLVVQTAAALPGILSGQRQTGPPHWIQ